MRKTKLLKYLFTTIPFASLWGGSYLAFPHYDVIINSWWGSPAAITWGASTGLSGILAVYYWTEDRRGY